MNLLAAAGQSTPMLVEDIDKLDLRERQRDVSEMLRDIELSEEEEAHARGSDAVDPAIIDDDLFEVGAWIKTTTI